VRNWFFNSKKGRKKLQPKNDPITFFMMPTKTELMHWRLQAILRENSFSDLEYLGERVSYKTGKDVPWYRIGEAEVPVDAITELDSEVEDDAL
tara:strand:- start:1415 stop:1693 length:279 start_codon:yes stop_codon:yes gene_type:complete